MPRLQGESVEDHACLAQFRLGVQLSEINIQLHDLLVDPLYACFPAHHLDVTTTNNYLARDGDIGQFRQGS